MWERAKLTDAEAHRSDADIAVALHVSRCGG
jgi:hypothetical protein